MTGRTDLVPLPSGGSALPSPLAQLAEGPIFVVGHVRSGTTWLYEMLVAHSEVAGVFESGVFSCFRELFDRSQWNPAYIASFREFVGHPLGVSQLISREQLVTDLRTLTARWFGEVLQPEHRFLVEKSPSHLFYMSDIAAVYPEARFVHIVRDGRDVIASAAAASAGWAKHWRYDSRRRMMLEWASAWSQQMRLARQQGAVLGDRYLEVRYEALRAQPRAELRSVFEHCGLPSSDAQLEGIVSSTPLVSDDVGFRRSGEIGGWTRDWNLVDARRFDRIAGDSLREMRYEEGKHWWLRAGLRRRARSGPRLNH